jgi:hypothetical protein
LIELITTTRPKPRSRMPGQTGWMVLKTPVRLVSITSCHCSGVILWNGASRVIPALAMTMSIGPRSASTCASPAFDAA